MSPPPPPPAFGPSFEVFNGNKYGTRIRTPVIENKYLLERGYLLSLHGGLGSFPIPLYKKDERYCSAKKWVHADSQGFFIYSFIDIEHPL